MKQVTGPASSNMALAMDSLAAMANDDMDIDIDMDVGDTMPLPEDLMLEV